MFASSTLAALVLISGSPQSNVIEDRVDLVEINHFYDDQGRLVFDQLIFYDWCPQTSKYQVRAWRLLKKPTQAPRHDSIRGVHQCLWLDGDVLRRVEAKQLRETWTQHDPELTARKDLPRDQRRQLLEYRVETAASQR